jgi:hypothetical protein
MTAWWLNNGLNIFLVEYSTLLIFTEVIHLLDSCQLTRELLEKGWCGIQGVHAYYRGKVLLSCARFEPMWFSPGGNVKKSVLQ